MENNFVDGPVFFQRFSIKFQDNYFSGIK